MTNKKIVKFSILIFGIILIPYLLGLPVVKYNCDNLYDIMRSPGGRFEGALCFAPFPEDIYGTTPSFGFGDFIGTYLLGLIVFSLIGITIILFYGLYKEFTK